MRLATLGYIHETNTFSWVPADFGKFITGGIYRGPEIVSRFRNAGHSLSGYIEASERFGFELVPLVFLQTGPIGMITKDAFDRISDELLGALKAQGPFDGVLLVLHGAAVSEAFHDPDGEIAARVRQLVGPAVPIGLAMDMHANLTQQTIENTTVTTLYNMNPHLDPQPRALHCADLIVRTIRGEIRPVQALETPPLVINILKQFTGEEPMASLMRDAAELAAQPGMLSTSVIEGYPYADVPEMGASFLAISDGDAALARRSAQWLAKRAWDRREEFVGDGPTPREALLYAAAAPKQPVVLMDVGDNIGGGSSADSTVLLAEAKRLGLRGLLQTLYDPEAVAACVAMGVGSEVTVKVGGKTDNLHGRPVEVTGRVRVIGDGVWVDDRPTHGGGRHFNAGRSVVLETTDDHTLVLTSRRSGNTSIEQMYCLGVHPEEKQIVIAKGVHSPRPAYTPIASEIVMVNTPGVTTADLSFFEYKNRRQPLFPFERDAVYDPAPSGEPTHA